MFQNFHCLPRLQISLKTRNASEKMSADPVAPPHRVANVVARYAPAGLPEDGVRVERDANGKVTGVFATRQFTKGEFVCYYRAEEWPGQQVQLEDLCVEAVGAHDPDPGPNLSLLDRIRSMLSCFGQSGQDNDIQK